MLMEPTNWWHTELQKQLTRVDCFTDRNGNNTGNNEYREKRYRSLQPEAGKENIIGWD